MAVSRRLEATAGYVLQGEVLCLDREGNVVQRFLEPEVKAYSSDTTASDALTRASAIENTASRG